MAESEQQPAETCGVTGCHEERHGSVPTASLLPGVREQISGEQRLPVCGHHGGEHHRFYDVGWHDE